MPNKIKNYRVGCPLWNKTYNLNEIAPNVPIRRLVNELSIRWINEKWIKIIKRGDLIKHLAIWEYHFVNCKNSESWGLYERRDIKEHERGKWAFRIVPCKLRWGVLLPFNQMDEHIKHNCNEKIRIRNLSKILEDLILLRIF